MAKEILEVERKFDLDPQSQIPPLDAVAPGALAGPTSQQQLVATYFDTEDLRLRAARVTLRHRTGDSDAGWHLKLPAGNARLEVHSSALPPPAPVPEELLALVRSRVRERPLLPVAVLTTSRTVHPLTDPDGRVLLEVVDDVVEGRRDGQEQVLSWREWEAELVGGDLALLDAVTERLLTAGATPSTTASKVGRVLEVTAPAGSAWWSRPPARPAKGASTAEAVRAHLAEQVTELLARDPQVRRDEHDAVHKMRVATRRLRSALSTFRPLLVRGETDPLRDELRWLAGTLGHARDAEVLHARLKGLLAEQPPELVLGPVAQRVDDVLLTRYREAHAHALTDLDSPRCLGLFEALEDLVAAPPWHELAEQPAKDVLPALVRRVDRRLIRTVRRADRSPSGEEQDLALHEARKLAKQLRYACEAVEPVFGRRAARMAAAVTDLQEVLGEHQDSVVTRDVLRQLGAGSSRAGQNGFTFGRLHGLEQARADARHEQWREVWERTSRRRLRRWLSG
jgi:CHAD domain-containing protein